MVHLKACLEISERMHMTPVRTRQYARTQGLACLCVALRGGASTRAAARAEQLQGNTTTCDVLVLGAVAGSLP